MVTSVLLSAVARCFTTVVSGFVSKNLFIIEKLGVGFKLIGH